MRRMAESMASGSVIFRRTQQTQRALAKFRFRRVNLLDGIITPAFPWYTPSGVNIHRLRVVPNRGDREGGGGFKG